MRRGGNVSKTREKSSNGETGVVSNRDTNLTIEPVKEPPKRGREAGEAEKILAAYPPDRLRGRAGLPCPDRRGREGRDRAGGLVAGGPSLRHR